MKQLISLTAFILGFFLTANLAIADTYEGVGIYLSQYKQDSYPVIIKVAMNSPAYIDCIDTGGKLISVNGHDTSNMNISDIINMLRGPKGTQVNIVINENGEDREYNLARSIIKEPTRLNTFYNPYYYSRPYYYRPISNVTKNKTNSKIKNAA